MPEEAPVTDAEPAPATPEEAPSPAGGPPSDEREPSAPSPAEPRPARHSDLAPTNFQLVVSTASFLAYGLIVLKAVGARIFAFWLGAGGYLFYSALLLLLGLRHWLDSREVAKSLLFYLPLASLFIPLSLALSRKRLGSLASAFYWFFPVPLVAALSLLAFYGGEEWLGARMRRWEDEQSINLWLMGNGLVYFAAALLGTRSRTDFVRFWGEFFFLLVPPSLLLPTNLLFRKGPELVDLGDRPFTLYALLSILISLSLVVLGTRMRRNLVAFPGLVGIAAFCFRVSEDHFRSLTSWPLSLAIAGAVCMAGALVLTFLRRKDPALPAPTRVRQEATRTRDERRLPTTD
jgi:hypothetical protein